MSLDPHIILLSRGSKGTFACPWIHTLFFYPGAQKELLHVPGSTSIYFIQGLKRNFCMSLDPLLFILSRGSKGTFACPWIHTLFFYPGVPKMSFYF